MAFNADLKARVAKRVIKKPRTAAEVAQPLGYKGQGIGRVLRELADEGTIVRHETKPRTYTKA